MFEYTPAEISSQIRALPPALFLWLRVMAVLNLSSLVFLRRRQARWVLGAFVFIAATNVPIFLMYGLVKLGSIPHLIVWIPLVIYLATQLRSGKVEIKSAFGIWCFAVMTVNIVSVVFDLRDGVQYLLGDHAPMSQIMPTGLPIPSLIAIAIALASASAYALGYSSTAASSSTHE